jgi:glycerophosphoryl diester phosphodiesterase
MSGFELQGHRGARGLFAENTVEGFLATLAIGVDSLELDVGVTRDGVVVVHHNLDLHPDIARDATGSWLAETDAPPPLLHALTLAELRHYDVGRLRPGSAYAALYPGQNGADLVRIPTLREVFDATAAAHATLDVELKTDPDRPGDTVSPEEMARKVVEVATACGALGRLVVRSFDWRGLAFLRQTHPAIPLAWLSVDERDPSRAIAASGAGGIWAPSWRDLDEISIATAQKAGLRVLPWTVNAPETMARLIAWGVDGFCTDRPDLARAVMRGQGLTLPEPR